MAINDNTLYGLTGAQIKELPGKINAAKGQAKVLTSDDYDYPVDNPIKVAAWLLEPGVYTAAPGVRVAGDTTAMAGLNSGVTLIIGATDSNNKKSIIMIPYTASDSMFPGGARTEMVDATTGAFSSADTWLASKNTKDSLTSNSTWEPLSANQGKVLKGLTDSIAIRGAGAPTTLTVGQVGTLYEDTTNGDLYICTDATNPYVWEEVGAGGGSGVKVLSSSDYNYPTDNPTAVALWLLEPGMYIQPSNAVSVYANNETATPSMVAGSFIIGNTKDGKKKILAFGAASDSTALLYSTTVSDGTKDYVRHLIDEDMITQTTGTSTTAVMSQNAVTSMVFADPSTKEKVQIGSGASASGGAYSTAIGSSANADYNYGIAIGSGTTAANAAHTTGIGGVALGYSAEAAAGGIAIGLSANATGSGSVALGRSSSAAQTGEVNIGSSNTSYGYNSSNYRLLTGLYEPQSDHDAATKGYVDGLVGDIETALNIVNNGGNA